MKADVPVNSGYCQKNGFYCELFKIEYQLDFFLRGPQIKWKGTCGLYLDKPNCENLKNGR